MTQDDVTDAEVTQALRVMDWTGDERPTLRRVLEDFAKGRAMSSGRETPFMDKDWCLAAANREREAEVEALRHRVTSLRTALENWGRHFYWCGYKVVDGRLCGCDCGLLDQLNGAPPISGLSAKGGAE